MNRLYLQKFGAQIFEDLSFVDQIDNESGEFLESKVDIDYKDPAWITNINANHLNMAENSPSSNNCLMNLQPTQSPLTSKVRRLRGPSQNLMLSKILFHCPKCNDICPEDRTIFMGTEARQCLACKTFVQFVCKDCNKNYSSRRSTYRHLKYECGKAPGFQCTKCNYKAFHKHNVKHHLLKYHKINSTSLKIKKEYIKSA